MTKVKSYLDGVEAAHKIRDKSEAKLKERTAELEDMVRRLVENGNAVCQALTWALAIMECDEAFLKENHPDMFDGLNKGALNAAKRKAQISTDRFLETIPEDLKGGETGLVNASVLEAAQLVPMEKSE